MRVCVCVYVCVIVHVGMSVYVFVCLCVCTAGVFESSSLVACSEGDLVTAIADLGWEVSVRV